MSSKAKHIKRSSRRNQLNVIPTNMFMAHALKVAEARFMREKSRIILDDSESEDAE